MTRHFPVRVNGIAFNPDEQSRQNERWRKTLAFAHLKEICHCMCVTAAPVPLTVRLYNRDKPSMFHGIALWPGTGLDHDPDCQHFDEAEGSSGGADQRPAFEEADDGKIRAHLLVSLGLTTSQKAVVADVLPKGPRSPKPTRSRASEVALVLKWWREARLNVFRGSPRSWYSAVYSLHTAAKRFVINKAGDSLADVTMFASGSRDMLASAHNQAVQQRLENKPGRLFVIGQLRTYKRDRAQILLPLRHFDLLPKILVTIAQLDAVTYKRPLLENLLDGKDGNVIVIACIESAGKGWWKTVSLSAIATNSSMVPVDSGYEIEFAQYLADHQRTFLKPVIVDEIDNNGNRPDFILLDTAPHVYCEVWGMQTREYLESKAARLKYFANQRQQVVNWTANPREEFPALPAKST